MKALWTAGLAALGGILISAGALAQPITLEQRPVPLYEAMPDETRNGELTYRGGLEISADHPGFGGLSGLWVTPGMTRFVAVSDLGYWFEADMETSGGARLTGLSNARYAPMLDASGRPITGKSQGDAEGLAFDGTDFLVSFERDHRVWRYAAPDGRAPVSARPRPVATPGELSSMPNNKGLEGIALVGGQLLLLSEEAIDDAGNISGWIGPATGITDAGRLALLRKKPYALTDLAVLPGGDVLTLERRFSPFTGPGMQIRRIAGGSIAPGAVLDGPVIASLMAGATVDNMEGLAAVPMADGGTALFVLSDDNQNAIQRTLLMMFTLR